MSTIIGVSFIQETCCNCGIIYALEEKYRDRLLAEKERGSTYCPNGHQWHYRGQSLEATITQLKLRVQEKDNAIDAERKKRERLERRVQRGICLYCKRTFGNLAKHMVCKHGDKKES